MMTLIGKLLSYTLIIGGIVFFERAIFRKSRREWVAFSILTGAAWLLGAVLSFSPNIPGPTDLMDAVYKPLGEILSK
jgi:hypothetical protein